MENITRMSERSRLVLQTLDEGSDLQENIWKLENLFHNHSERLQRLELVIKVQHAPQQKRNEELF